MSAKRLLGSVIPAFFFGLLLWALMLPLLWPSVAYLQGAAITATYVLGLIGFIVYIAIALVYSVAWSVGVASAWWVVCMWRRGDLRRRWKVFAAGSLALVAGTLAGRAILPYAQDLSRLEVEPGEMGILWAVGYYLFWGLLALTLFVAVRLAWLAACWLRRHTAGRKAGRSGDAVAEEGGGHESTPPDGTATRRRSAVLVFWLGVAVGLFTLPLTGPALFPVWLETVGRRWIVAQGFTTDVPLADLTLTDVGVFQFHYLALCLLCAGLVALVFRAMIAAVLHWRSRQSPAADEEQLKGRGRRIVWGSAAGALAALAATCVTLGLVMGRPEPSTERLRLEATRGVQLLAEWIGSYNVFDKAAFPNGDVHALFDWLSRMPRGPAEAAGYFMRPGKRTLYDPWGHELVYRRPSARHPMFFDLYSVGPNGIDEEGGGDDVGCENVLKAWEASVRSGALDITGTGANAP